jgi:serine/threonine protein kinase
MENRKKITNYMIFLDNKLGEGAFGKVYTGEEDETKKKVAIKILEKKKSNKVFIQLIKNNILKQLSFLRLRY